MSWRFLSHTCFSISLLLTLSFQRICKEWFKNGSIMVQYGFIIPVGVLMSFEGYEGYKGYSNSLGSNHSVQDTK